jgi:hypothetical protein
LRYSVMPTSGATLDGGEGAGAPTLAPEFTGHLWALSYNPSVSFLSPTCIWRALR